MDRRDYDTGDRYFFHTEESVNVPGFHALLKSGARLPVNPYLWREIRAESPYSLTYNGWKTERDARGLYRIVDACLTGVYANQVGGVVATPSFEELNAVVSNRLLDKIRHVDIDLGVALGEFGETFDLFASAARTLAKGYKAAKRGNVAGVVRAFTGSSAQSRVTDVAKSGAGALLTWRYGISPLVNDCFNAWDLLCGDPVVRTVKVVRSAMSKSFDVADFNSFGYYHDTGHANMRVRGEVQFRITNPVLKTLDQLGLTNPLSVAWELVPLSFVVDWFVPVGDYVQSLVPPQGVEFVDGWIVNKATAYGRHWTTIPGDPGWFTEHRYTELYKRRYRLSSFPRYQVTPPRWDLSGSQLSSAVALLTQRLVK